MTNHAELADPAKVQLIHRIRQSLQRYGNGIDVSTLRFKKVLNSEKSSRPDSPTSLSEVVSVDIPKRGPTSAGRHKHGKPASHVSGSVCGPKYDGEVYNPASVDLNAIEALVEPYICTRPMNSDDDTSDSEDDDDSFFFTARARATLPVRSAFPRPPSTARTVGPFISMPDRFDPCLESIEEVENDLEHA
jgi:hypothetical protein